MLKSQQAVITADRLGEIDLQDSDGKTMLMKLVEKDDIHAAVTAVDYARADLTIKDNQGKTAYDYANELDCHPLFKELTKPPVPSPSPKKGCWQSLKEIVGLGR